MGAITFHLLTADTAPLLMGANVFDNPVDQNQLDAFVADHGHQMFFAMQSGEVVGMASGNILLHPDKEPIFFINEIGVTENMRNRGIATDLTLRLMDLAREKGCRGIWLATESDNLAARALYKKLKARETEAVVVYDWDGAMDE